MVNYKSFLLLIFTVILLSSNLFAQENYQPGYIVKLNGDTLTGFIDYRNWENNPSKIEFKQSVKGPVSIYKPLSIKAFGVADEIYLSAIIETETSPTAINNLDEYPELSIVKDTAFITVLVRGTKSLLSYKSRSGKENFFIEENGEYILLRQKKYLRKVDNKTIVSESKKYVGQLKLYLSDCSDLDSRTQKLEYDSETLVSYFKAYYSCIKGETKFEDNRKAFRLTAGILAGMTSTKLNLIGTSYYPDPVFDPSKDFAGGIYLNCLLGRNRQKWSIYNELNYTSYSGETTFKDFENKTITATMNFSYIKLLHMARFSYPVNKIRLFVNAGVSNGIYLGNGNRAVKIPASGVPGLITEQPLFKEIRKLDVGFMAGAGLQYKRLSGEIRYEGSDGMSPYVDISSKIKRLYFLIGYRVL